MTVNKLNTKKEVVLITGANGLVASRLSQVLSRDYDLRFLTRYKKNDGEYQWDLKSGYIDLDALFGVDYIIHLAGAGVADKRWTKKRKLEIESSRVDTAKLILKTLLKNKIKINSFISASGIGFYGSKISSKIFTEYDKRGSGFLSDVCYHWESVADRFVVEGVSKRSVVFRIGIVLSKNGGALKKMMFPIKYHLGTILGSGNQYMPWIHIDDLCRLFKYSIENDQIKEIYNAVAPQHITNEEFTRQIAKYLNRSLYLRNLPSFMIKLIFGESSILLLNGSRVSCQKIVKTGFTFRYPELKTALLNLD